MIELLAVTGPGGAPPPDDLRALPAGELLAIVGPATDEEVTPELLWRRDELIESLMADRDVLPVRFGTRFEHDADAAEAIAEREPALASALARVRGAVEVSVRVIADDAAPIDAELRALARDAAEHRPRPPEAMRAAYLVDRERLQAFADRVAQLEAERPGVQILCTGPWAPYSFCDA
jgi:hypothetical protein